MSTLPGSLKLVKAGFVQLDATTGAVQRIIVFQYNPETLARRLEGVDPATPPPPSPGAPPSPRETVSFTLAFDAADALDQGDPVSQQYGILPILSALELLLYLGSTSLTVWVSGAQRVMPVRITEVQITEQAFDATLNPIRAQVAVTLLILKDDDLAKGSHGRALWDAHFTRLQQLVNSMPAGSLSTLGLTGI